LFAFIQIPYEIPTERMEEDKKRFIPEKSFTSARFLKGCFHLFSVKFFPFPSKTFLYSLFSYLQNRIE